MTMSHGDPSIVYEKQLDNASPRNQEAVECTGLLRMRNWVRSDADVLWQGHSSLQVAMRTNGTRLYQVYFNLYVYTSHYIKSKV